MEKKIAEAGIELLPIIDESRIKNVMNRVDKIAQTSNAGISRIANARGGMLGVGGAMLGLAFNPLTLAIGVVVAIFMKLSNTVDKFNNKFQDFNNQLMDEARKQNQALADMGGNNKENNIMYRVLDSQGINTSNIYKNINERMEREDLQKYKGVNKNDFIINLVNQARGMGIVDGKKYLEDMKLVELEPLLYSQSSIEDLQNDVVAQAKVKGNGYDLSGQNVFNNARQGEKQLAVDFTRKADQSTKIKEIVVKAANVVKDNEHSLTKKQYEELAEQISKTTIALSNFKKAVDESSISLWGKIKEAWKEITKGDFFSEFLKAFGNHGGGRFPTPTIFHDNNESPKD